MSQPLFKKRLYCLPPFKGKQNPFFVTLYVWSGRTAARTHFKDLSGRVWAKSDSAYFLAFEGCAKELGELHFLVSNIRPQLIAHECVHAAQSFAKCHELQPVTHCLYDIRNSMEECVASVAGYLSEACFLSLPEKVKARCLSNALSPL